MKETMEFDVVSIKPHVCFNPGTFRIYEGKPQPHATGNRYAGSRIALRDLVEQAWGLDEFEISGLPGWARPKPSAVWGTYFDVDGAAPPGMQPDTGQWQQMLRSMLADRFQLKAHPEVRPMPVYALAAGKDGAKLRRLSDDEELTVGLTPEQSTPERMPRINVRFSGLLRFIRNNADRPVVDETGLSGNYEVPNIDFRQIARQRHRDPAGGWRVVEAALRDDFGLEVKPRTDNIEMLIVDHVGKPRPN